MAFKVVLGKDLLAENQKKAEHLRHEFGRLSVRAINILSSPGAGKTTMLQNIIPRLSDLRIGVIEGDVATTRDAERLSALGIPVVQIETQGACHLDSGMVWEALSEIDPKGLDLLFIENVGNLVCPASFDLGEHLRMLLFSVTEGGDKPMKYPKAFLTSNVVVINKLDLLPYTDVDLTALEKEIKEMNPSIKVFRISCRTGEGLDELEQWLRDYVRTSPKTIE